MKIRTFAHKGLKRLYADDVAKGVPHDTVDKLRKMLAFLDDRTTQKNCGLFRRGRCIH
jgi:plasmid maintenance system killer protein